MGVGGTFWYVPANCCFRQAQNYKSAHCILILPAQISSDAFVKYTTITISNKYFIPTTEKRLFSVGDLFGEKMTPALISNF